MHQPTAPKIPILNKSCLFVHTPSEPQNPSRRYLQCPATGHLYCTSTGSLYQKTIIPLYVNISPLLSINSGLLPSNPTSCTIKSSSVCTNNINQQDNGASTSTENNTSPKAKDVKQPIQGNNASMSNTVPSVKNADQQVQGTSAPKTHRNKASKSKVDTTTQVNSPVQGASSFSVCSQSYSDLTTKKKLKKCSRKTKKSNSSAGSQSNPDPTTEKEMEHSTKTNKSNSYFSQSNSDPTTEKAMKHNTKTNKSNSYFSQSNSDLTTEKAMKHNTKTNKSNSYFSQSNSDLTTEKAMKHNTKTNKSNSYFSQSNSSAGGQSNSNPTTKKEKKRSRKTKKSNSSAGGQSYSDAKKEKKGKLGPVYQGFKISYRWLRPFNRRPYPYRDRQKSLLSSKYKNCIMASSVHEIIHSRFAKNTDEHMPVSQVRAMLSSGDRKVKMRNELIQRMEEEAIHKYKKMNLEEHKQRLHVKEYDVVHHPEKYWLVSYGRWVINRKDKETWPLMVKCLHKYPDSTLRQTCKHRSFCLKWNGTYYTLRTDHAYYTQIQCHMAVTDTPYAELIVHTHKETTFLPVYFDSDFWKQTEVTLETFFTSNIQPYLKKISQIKSKNVTLDSDMSNVIIEE
ncbi:uncharacterized protein LOC120998046 isoform X2 [Bufo bufo]|uniref:uncharacterized protein LOC120998046 isoform X2 n=1 Tax=Bufo bufo TaxID=8384 RepID=UPI001ABDD4A1|nr:uncharacterized protein LOC120998046 isoform X2 [Bufo bufo]